MREHDRQHRNGEYSPAREDGPDGGLADLLDRCGHVYVHRVGASHRGQDRVLSWLAAHPDATQKELSEGLGVMPASLSEVLMKLERKGYITRIRDEADRRFMRVQLTAEGEQALDEPEADSGSPFAVLSEAEQAQLAHLLAKLLEDWETRYQRPGRGHSGHGHGHRGRGCGHSCRGREGGPDHPYRGHGGEGSSHVE